MDIATCYTDVGYYLELANEALNKIVEIDSFSEIFEAGNPEVQEQMANNEKAKKEGQGFLAKAGKALLDLYHRVVDSIADLIQKTRLNKLQREAYDAFVKACKEDPSLKNKKIRVKDYRKICEEHDAILKEVEEADKKLAQGKNVDIEALQQKISNFGNSTGKAAVTTLTVEAILNTASQNQAWAANAYNLLRNNSKVYEALCNSMGEKQVKKTEKELKALSKRATLRRFWLAKTGRSYSNVYEATVGALKSVKDVCESGTSLGMDIMNATNSDIVSMSTEGPIKRGVRKATMVPKAAFTVLKNKENRDKAWTVAKNRRMINNFKGGQYINSGLKGILSTKKDIEKAARQYARGRIWDERKKKWIIAPIDAVIDQVNSALDILSPAETDAFMALIPQKFQPSVKLTKNVGKKYLKQGNNAIDTIAHTFD